MVEIRPNAGPQEQFLSCQADIAIYGGSAGGGKTWALLLDPLRFVHVPDFQAVIFRRTTEQVRTAGGLWDESANLYPLVAGKPREQQLDWHFVNASIRFEHLQHEQSKLNYQGAQIAYMGFDELTHFTETQFWYMLSRSRSTCGVRPYIRATCNPESESWVAKLIAWWIDQETGFPIAERSGVLRWFVRFGGELLWFDKREDAVAHQVSQGMDYATAVVSPKSLTFIPAKLSDNPKLTSRDPSYLANLMALPKVERARLLDGNWKVSSAEIIDPRWLRSFTMRGDYFHAILGGQLLVIDSTQCRRFATIDTAGTSRQLAEIKKGKPASWSVCGIWDYWPKNDILFLRHVWRAQVGWNELKTRVPSVLETWNCPRAYIENAHHGPALKDEITGRAVELIGPVIPGMREVHKGAKLDRAVACGLLSRLEDGRMVFPDEHPPWWPDFRGELIGWDGLPESTADQIDMSSYASYVCKRITTAWGGRVGQTKMARGRV